jgi:hypothetical protein
MNQVESEDAVDDPRNRMFRVSTRGNSDFKWQTKGVVGAFEVCSQPGLDLSAPFNPMLGKGAVFEKWKEAQNIWKSMNLRESFIEAAEGIPVETCCCGLITDEKKRIEEMVPRLNETWAKSVNEKLEEKGFFVDIHLWTWSNISGQATTDILLIRVHEKTQ